MASSAITVISAQGSILNEILDATYGIWSDGLSRSAYGRGDAAQLRTPWGQLHLSRLALVDGDLLLASARQYELSAVLEGRPVRVLGLGALFTQPAHRGRGHARRLVEQIIGRASQQGFGLALLFSEIGTEYYAPLGFAPIEMRDVILRVIESPRYGAPATMIRGGDDRDLAAIAAMGRARAEACRFHLDRDPDFIKYAIARKRLRAGLGPAGARELHFFIAEEGAEAAAYVVLSAGSGEWILEECGDRDPSGARVGAMLQALVAREPAERRLPIRGWLPRGFLPPQLEVVETRVPSELMMIRVLTDARRSPALEAGDVLYWRGDLI